MHKRIHALTLALMLSVAFPVLASTISISGANFPLAPTTSSGGTSITGADGPLVPAKDYTLPYRADGIFEFSKIDVGVGVTLRFDAQMKSVKLLSLGDILIAGAIDASGIDLALETPGRIVITGSSSILADSLSLSTNTMSQPGTIRLLADSMVSGGGFSLIGPLGNISLHRAGGDLTLIRLSVPEPATPWLVATLLPMLMLFGRKHTSHGR